VGSYRRQWGGIGGSGEVYLAAGRYRRKREGIEGSREV